MGKQIIFECHTLCAVCMWKKSKDMKTCVPLQTVDVQTKYAPLFAGGKYKCRREDLLLLSTNSGRRFASSVCANVGGAKIVREGMLFFYGRVVTFFEP